MRKPRIFKKPEILPDPKYNSIYVEKLIKILMRDGKKDIVAYRIVYPAIQRLIDFYFKNFDDIKKDENAYVDKILSKVFNVLMLKYKIRTYKFGGATFKIPVLTRHESNNFLTEAYIKPLHILAKILRNRHKFYREINNTHYKGKDAAEKLYNELSLALNSKGETVRLKKEIEATAVANRAFAHLGVSRRQKSHERSN